MSVKVARDVLVAASAVTALVPADRISPLVRTQGFGLPAITLQRISMTPSNHLRGDGLADANRVQVDIYAETSASALAIAAACRTALVAAGHRLQNELDDYEQEPLPVLYRVTQEFSIWT